MNAHDLFVLKERKKNIKAKRCSAFIQTNSFTSPAAVYEITFYKWQTVQTFSCRNFRLLLLVLLRMYLYYTNSYLLSHFLFIARFMLSVSLTNNNNKKHIIIRKTVVKLQLGSASALYIAHEIPPQKKNPLSLSNPFNLSLNKIFN